MNRQKTSSLFSIVKLTVLFLGTSFLLCLAGCVKLFSPDGPGDVPELRLSLGTYIDSTTRKLRINAQGGDYDFHNVRIPTSFQNEGNKCILRFMETECSGGCSESTDDTDRPAEGYCLIPELPDSNYPIEVYFGNAKVEGALLVQPDAFGLILFESDHHTFGDGMNVIGRDPYNSVALTFKGFQNHQSMQDLIDTLQSHANFADLSLPPGRYQRFKVDEAGMPWVNGSYSNNTDTTILKTYNGLMNDVNAFNFLQVHFDNWKLSHPFYSDCIECRVTLHYGSASTAVLN